MKIPFSAVQVRADDRDAFDDLRSVISERIGREVTNVELFRAMVTLMTSECRTHNFFATWAALTGEAKE